MLTTIEVFGCLMALWLMVVGGITVVERFVPAVFNRLFGHQ